MPLDNPKPSPNLASEFMVSAYPWVTSSVASGIISHEFSYVTKFVTVKNTGQQVIRVGFTPNGIVGRNYYPLSGSETFSAEVKVKQLYISGSGQTYSVIAGLTGIESNFLTFLTSSRGYDGVG